MFCILLFLCVLACSYAIIDCSVNAQLRSMNKINTYGTTDFKQSYVDEQTALAHQYNQNLIHGVKDNNYTEILNTDGFGMIGYLSVPSLSIKVPIFHETSDDSLSYGVFHIKDTSFPASGKGTHAVIANGYREIKKLKKGDKFYVTVFNQTHEYEVDQIADPTETGDYPDMSVNPNEEYVTLCNNNSGFGVRGKCIDVHNKIFKEISTSEPITPFAFTVEFLICVASAYVLGCNT